MSAADMIAGMFRYESRAAAGPMQMASSARCTGRLCASASLYTSTDWIPSSRQARITRRAISPRLAMRTLSKDRKRLLHGLHVGHIGRPDLGKDPLHQSGQDVAWPELDEHGRALPSRVPHGAHPLYRRPHLFFEQMREIASVLMHFGIDVRDHREAQLLPRCGS